MDIKDSKSIPIFIISYNRFSYLSKQVNYFEDKGYKNLIIIDNHSSQPELIEYLKTSPYQVYMLKKNLGHLVVWKYKPLRRIIRNQMYAVTDCDILPVAECPDDFMDKFIYYLKKYPFFTKAGFALKIDDIPDKYFNKQKVIDWEEQYWKKELEADVYDAYIDTTFALYKPGIYTNKKKWWFSIRVGQPYLARHLPWYCDNLKQSEEDLYYQTTLNVFDAHWSVTDIKILHEKIDMLKRDYYHIKKPFFIVKLKQYLKSFFKKR